jgi:solute carrier family 25 (mitochondrial carnitine/acylcarnitine transporter), member 20/29
MCAGAVVSLVASPTEMIKCRLQHQGTYASALQKYKAWEAGGKTGWAPTLYKGPIDVLKSVYKNEAGFRGLTNGLGSTLAREIPGNGIMFCVYEGLKMQLAKWQARALRLADTLKLARLHAHNVAVDVPSLVAWHQP